MVEIIKLKIIDSTNNFAKELIEKFNVEKFRNSIIYALEQTQGRGTGNNKWLSEPYKNLTFSIIHIPDYLNPSEIFYLSKAISIGIVDFLESLGLRPKIKWPNDIFVDNKKIAGILIETAISHNRLKYAIIGIGLNVNQTNFPASINATSLKLLTQKDYDLDTLLEELVEKIFYWLEQLRQQKLQDIDKKYLSHLYLYQQPAKFKQNNKVIDGQIVGVDQYGRLLLKLLNKEKFITFNQKEVEYVI